ncbi:MAG TPA: 4Fe-4S ferredoxin, partial [Desulfosporosinus sp.]|nr:4Fe-4S ferredoxin [Desulfosporosinus sp.]
MSLNRRQFLRKAGMVTALGMGGAFTITELRGKVEASEYETPQQGLVAKRWAMVVDMSKFKTKEDYDRVIEACHSVHNVPYLGNPKDEIKWIWSEDYEHSFT